MQIANVNKADPCDLELVALPRLWQMKGLVPKKHHKRTNVNKTELVITQNESVILFCNTSFHFHWHDEWWMGGNISALHLRLFDGKQVCL